VRKKEKKKSQKSDELFRHHQDHLAVHVSNLKLLLNVKREGMKELIDESVRVAYLFCANRCSISGHRISLSRVATMAVKAGRWARSFCQQSNMRLWIASGQSIGAGSLDMAK